MLAQFQARYPTGSLNSELLTIYQGKFIVRVSVQVEGVTRATGMAAAETLEVAEDRARSRALMVLGIHSETQLLPHSSSDNTTEVPTQRKETVFASALPAQQVQTSSTTATSPDDRNYGFSPDPAFMEASRPAPALELDDRLTTIPPAKPVSEPQSAVGNWKLPADPQAKTSEETPAVVPLSKETSLFTNYEPQESADVVELGAKTGVSIDEPIDLSDAIARTTVELKRLGWTNKKGRDYLEQTYGVRSRQQLDNEQMLEFLHYLESQPSPSK